MRKINICCNIKTNRCFTSFRMTTSIFVILSIAKNLFHNTRRKNAFLRLLNIEVIIFVLSIFSTATPLYAWSKVDPFLMGVYNAVNNANANPSFSILSSSMFAGKSITISSSGQTMVNVLIRAAVPGDVKRFIENNGGMTGTSIDDIITATIPLSMVPELVSRHDITKISLSKQLHLLLDKSVPAVYGNIVHAGTGLPRPYTGRDVIVGIVDTGLDLTHADLHYPDGSTKVIALWDQTSVNPKYPAPQGYSYGSEYTGYEINQGLCNEQDTVGHGTHVAGIIASSNPVYTGMAPDAMLVIVKTDLNEAHVLDGINYVFSLASQYHVPAVVNLSLGAQIGPHDDSTSFEQALDSLVQQAPARAVSVAAGNDGGNPVHLGFIMPASASYASYFSVVTNSENPGSSVIDLWYTTPSPDLSFALGVIDPSGNILTETSFVLPKQSLSDTLINISSGIGYGCASIDATNTGSGGTNENEVELSITNNCNTGIDLTQSLYTYRYAIFIQNNGTKAQAFNGWLATDNSAFDTQTTIPSIAGYTVTQGDTSDTVSLPATARYAVAVGSFVTKQYWYSNQTAGSSCPTAPCRYGFTDTMPIGDLSFFSSKGPTPDPSVTGQKPNLTAPGEVIVSALSTQASFDPGLITRDGSHVVLRGTSMASPHVTGAIALLFDRNDALDITETMTLLETTASQDSTTGTVPNNNWGFGKLNALQLVESITPTAENTTPPAVSSVTGIATGPSSAQISWSTDELSTSYVKYWNASNPGSAISTGTTTMTESHIVNFSNLSANTNYAYQVISIDPVGNIAVYPSPNASQTLSFTTPSAGTSSNGCMCEQSNGFNPGDALPVIILMSAWLILFISVRKKNKFYL